MTRRGPRKLAVTGRTGDRSELPSAGDRHGQRIVGAAFVRVDIAILREGLDFKADVDSVASAEILWKLT